jgi:hypothetical protein
MLGFDDDEHLEEWISENPQWCDVVKGSEVFNECQHQCFVTAGATSLTKILPTSMLLFTSAVILIFSVFILFLL